MKATRPPKRFSARTASPSTEHSERTSARPMPQCSPVPVRELSRRKNRSKIRSKASSGDDHVVGRGLSASQPLLAIECGVHRMPGLLQPAAERLRQWAIILVEPSHFSTETEHGKTIQEVKLDSG
jgi:hypothetical protein